MGLRKLTLDEVEISLTIEVDDHGPEGCFATGNDAQDEKMVREIREKMARGDVWAWCVVTVKARWNGFIGTDTLGECSYKDEKDFREDGYGDLVGEALDDLNGSIFDTHSRLRELVG